MAPWQRWKEGNSDRDLGVSSACAPATGATQGTSARGGGVKRCRTSERDRLPEKAPMFWVLFRLPPRLVAMGMLPDAVPLGPAAVAGMPTALLEPTAGRCGAPVAAGSSTSAS